MQLKAVALQEIIKKIPPVAVYGNRKVQIRKVVPFSVENQDANTLSWLGIKDAELAYRYAHGVLIAPTSINPEQLPSTATFLLYEKPRKAFRDILYLFFATQEQPTGIAPSAFIASDVKIGLNVSIGHNTVIENNVIIGDNVRIGHGNIILCNTVIGNHVIIGNNNTIGGIGFGYEKNEDGQYELIPHLGNVVIQDHVEIGNNNCIDRAVLGSTLIKQNVKIDNLVHISHGVEIGENSLIIAHAIICGSVKIGANVWVAPNSAIRNKVTVGDNSTIGLGAIVIKDVPENNTVIGNPARPI
jgi:UDP-3-O-[3-hydroxymyristoyl] glucosamine N-acyltransferase